MLITNKILEHIMPSLNFSNLQRYRFRQITALTNQKAKEQITEKPGRITAVISMRRSTASTETFKLHDGLLADVAYADEDDAVILSAVQGTISCFTGATNISIPYDKLAITFPATLPANIEYLILYEDSEFGG